jgi:hypothetical protein
LNAPHVFTIEGVEGAKGQTIRVVRDDLIDGGTKARVLPAILPLLGPADFVYSSPVYGHAQIALAIACAAIGRTAHIFCAKRRDWHHLTHEASDRGAVIHQCDMGYLSVTNARAREFAEIEGHTLLPFGLDCELMIDALANAARYIPAPREVWSVASSGTLTRALQRAWPDAKFYCVKVGAEPDRGQAWMYEAPEPFARDAKIAPPFPSTSNYDAKAWRFVRALASDGALFWNVAR